MSARCLLLAGSLPTLALVLGCSSDKGLYVDVNNAVPTATILSAYAEAFSHGADATFEGTVSDDSDAWDEDLVITWLLGDDTEAIEGCAGLSPTLTGYTSCQVTLPDDTTIEALPLGLYVEDPEGASAVDWITLTMTPNTAPQAQITSPEAGGAYISNALIVFEGVTTDAEELNSELAVSWTSSLDGELDWYEYSGPNEGGDVYGTAYLSEGTHTITLRAADSAGRYDEDFVTVEVGPPHPTPPSQIPQPAEGAVGAAGDTVNLRAVVFDPDQSPDNLSLTWSSDRDGAFNEGAIADSVTGEVSTWAVSQREDESEGGGDYDLSIGTHVITLQVFDDYGASCSDSVTYTVGGGPSVVITSPEDGALEGLGGATLFSAEISDREDACEDLYATWGLILPEGGLEVIREGYAEGCAPAFTYEGLTEGEHTVQLSVSDTDGNTNSAIVQISVEDCLATWYYDADGDGYGDDAVSTEACEAPAHYVDQGGDCEDNVSTTYPGAVELCDGLDNNCEGTIDEGLGKVSYYYDGDADGYGDPDTTIAACYTPPDHVSSAGDCDDSNDDINPGADEVCDGVDNDCDGVIDSDTAASLMTTWYQDSDADGYGDPGTTAAACTAPAGFVANDEDCDDGRAATSPAAAEVCDEVDNNCDGVVDNNPVDGDTWYLDVDGDLYGDPDATGTACSLTEGFTTDNSDCDDSNASINPTGAEECDDLDNDCDGVIDEGALTTWYRDADTDGYGDEGDTVTDACDAPSGYVGVGGDCDDTDVTINPGAEEVCNGVDDNCNGDVDSDDAAIDSSTGVTWYQDSDEDGYGDPDNTTESCDQPDGYVLNDEDCNDGDIAISPAAVETCDEVDEDCDGVVDNNPVDGDTYYEDLDGDLYGTEGSLTTACEAPEGYVSAGSALYDCDDSNAEINPSAGEDCDDLDNDCDELVDEDVVTTWYFDQDGDGYGTPDYTYESCESPSSYYVDQGGDCDDTDGDIHYGAQEICNNQDDDCDGDIDDADGSVDLSTGSTFYADADGDGYGSESAGAATAVACAAPEGFAPNTEDCDDTDGGINPAAAESCDGEDQDCDGDTDEGYDGDLDGVTSCEGDCNDGDADSYPGAPEACDGRDNDCDSYTDEGPDGDGDGFTVCAGDCDDDNYSVHPGASEACDSEDDDCDGWTDEGVTAYYYADDDGDGYGDGWDVSLACETPEGYTANNDDCDDTDGDVNPGEAEACDGADQDCDGAVDEGAADSDGDGTCDALDSEACDGLDNDGDAAVDEGLSCTVGLVSWYDDDCNSGHCPTDCATGSGTGLLESVDAVEGECHDLSSSTINTAAQVDIFPDCPSGSQLTITVFKEAGCTGTSTSLTVSCDSAGEAWNLNCEDSNGDGYGDFDDHVDSFTATMH